MGHSHLPSKAGRVRTWRNGRRARLRIWCLTAYEFESHRPHSNPSIKHPSKYVEHAVVAQLVERHLAKVEVAGPSPVYRSTCGCSSMAELQPSKLATRVRFPSPAPEKVLPRKGLFAGTVLFLLCDKFFLRRNRRNTCIIGICMLHCFRSFLEK